MEDTQEIEDKTTEAISDNASQKKEETRDEMLARHRSFIYHKSKLSVHCFSFCLFLDFNYSATMMVSGCFWFIPSFPAYKW